MKKTMTGSKSKRNFITHYYPCFSALQSTSLVACPPRRVPMKNAARSRRAPRFSPDRFPSRLDAEGPIVTACSEVASSCRSKKSLFCYDLQRDLNRNVSLRNIDLHTHSKVSDGLLSPAELVCKAAALGVDVLALTDHDDLRGLPEARAAAEEAG